MSSQRTGQRSFRLTTEAMAASWEETITASGMSQQKAIETLIEALGAGLIDLNELRAELTKRARSQK